MTRINLAQAINLNLLLKRDDDRVIPVTIALQRGVNDLSELVKPHHGLAETAILQHQFVQAHVKAGSISLVPDAPDPAVVAAANAEIAERAHAEAEAMKALKAEKQREIDQALAKAKEQAAEIVRQAQEEAAAVKLAAEKHAEEAEFQRLLKAEEAEAEAKKADASKA